jgi:protein SCO1/2
MKKILTLLAAVVLVTGSFSSCSNSTTQAATYQCPMKCEGDKTYDKAGSCAVCGMALEEVKK